MIWNNIFCGASIILLIVMFAFLVLLAFNNLFARHKKLMFAFELSLSFISIVLGSLIETISKVIRFDSLSIIMAMIVGLICYTIILYFVYMHMTTELGKQIIHINPEDNDTSQMIRKWIEMPRESKKQSRKDGHKFFF